MSMGGKEVMGVMDFMDVSATVTLTVTVRPSISVLPLYVQSLNGTGEPRAARKWDLRW